MMNRFQAMLVFTKIVEMNSFSRAADSLNIPKASATTIIKNLEAHLKVRLLHRTTRRINLTTEGAQYYERCVRILADVDETENLLTSAGSSIHGKLRIDLPPAIGRLVVMPSLPAFRSQYPEIDLAISFSDRRVDLVQEGVDCAIRVGLLEDSSLVAKHLARLQILTLASPQYIQRHGLPRRPEDLSEHFAIHLFSGQNGRNCDFNFVRDGHVAEVRVPGIIAVSDIDAYIKCGLDGMGLIQAPRFMVGSHLTSGAFVEVMPHQKPRPMPISAVYPPNRHLTSKVRVFVDWAASIFDGRVQRQNELAKENSASSDEKKHGEKSPPNPKALSDIEAGISQ